MTEDCEYRDTHIEIAQRLTAVEEQVHSLKIRLQEYDVTGLKEVVGELRRDIAVLRTKLWFYQMGATAAGGLIVLLMNKLMEK